MRVSTTMIYNMSTVNINDQYEQLFKLNEQVTTSKRINRPSDDPIDVCKVLDYRTLLGSIEQYKKNVDRGTSLLQYTESAFEKAKEVLDEAKTLAVQMSTTYSEDQREAASVAAEQFFRQVLQISNTQVSGRYIFSGFKTDTAAFSADDALNVTYNGDDNQIRLAVQQNSAVTVNITGQAAFMDDTNVFNVLRDLRNALRDNNVDEIQKTLPRFDDAISQLVKVRAYVGTSLKELEASKYILEDFKLNSETLLSNTEDTDMADAVTKLSERKLVFEASLKSTSMITQLSLVNFV